MPIYTTTTFLEQCYHWKLFEKGIVYCLAKYICMSAKLREINDLNIYFNIDVFASLLTPPS